MRTLGLIGGMSWESTVPFYKRINELVRDRLGGLHSARLVLYSVDFDDIEPHMRAGEWDAIGRKLAEAARKVEGAGADGLVLCTNTMHRVIGAVEAAIRIPVLHIVDSTAEAVRGAGMRKVALLGTRFTMEQDFFRDRLRDRHGIDSFVPDEPDRTALNRIIFEELCVGIVTDESHRAFRNLIDTLAERGAEGVILGCTELAMLVDASGPPVPLFDTTELHARRAAEWALSA